MSIATYLHAHRPSTQQTLSGLAAGGSILLSLFLLALFLIFSLISFLSSIITPFSYQFFGPTTWFTHLSNLTRHASTALATLHHRLSVRTHLKTLTSRAARLETALAASNARNHDLEAELADLTAARIADNEAHNSQHRRAARAADSALAAAQRAAENRFNASAADDRSYRRKHLKKVAALEDRALAAEKGLDATRKELAVMTRERGACMTAEAVANIERRRVEKEVVRGLEKQVGRLEGDLAVAERKMAGRAYEVMTSYANLHFAKVEAGFWEGVYGREVEGEREAVVGLILARGAEGMVGEVEGRVEAERRRREMEVEAERMRREREVETEMQADREVEEGRLGAFSEVAAALLAGCEA